MASMTSDQKLAALSDLFDESDQQVLTVALKTYLADKHNRVLAKAAQLVEEKLLYELEPELKQAYQRMLPDAVKKDANCIAKSAIMHTLVTLDSDDVDFYLAGLRYQQQEPVWGGSVDTAVDIRCSSAMGLISTTYLRAMIELVGLLNDSEASARAGAIRAMRYGQPYEAALVLRQKIMQGDSEVEILGECFITLLQVEPQHSLPLISRYLEEDDEDLYELAALALGQSHLDDALLRLQEAWKETFSIHQRQRQVIIRAVVQHRSDEAFDWLLSILMTGDESLVNSIIEQLSLYKGNVKLKLRLKKLLVEIDDKGHLDVFEKHW